MSKQTDEDDRDRLWWAGAFAPPLEEVEEVEEVEDDRDRLWRVLALLCAMCCVDVPERPADR